MVKMFSVDCIDEGYREEICPGKKCLVQEGGFSKVKGKWKEKQRRETGCVRGNTMSIANHSAKEEKHNMNGRRVVGRFREKKLGEKRSEGLKEKGQVEQAAKQGRIRDSMDAAHA